MDSPSLRYLSARDVQSASPSMSDLIQSIEAMFVEKGHGRAEMPPKPGVHPRPDAFVHAMPAYLPSMEALGIKWVSGYPGNAGRGLPYIHGLIVINDPENGRPLAVLDATWITAQRTGAATAVAARHLARSDSASLGIVACGVQGRANLEALACVFRLRRVLAYDLDPNISAQFAREMSNRHGIEVTPVLTLAEAVRDLDLVVTSAPILRRPRPPIEAGWLAEGAFACTLDFDSSWQGAALSRADRLVTDDREQFVAFRREGYFRETPEPHADLGHVVAGREAGRKTARERTICINLGIALEDVVAATLVYRRARERDIGVILPL